MSKIADDGMALTKNQSLVMNALSAAEGPLSAYTILDELREHGLKAPLQIYRALDKLMQLGLVHRLESLNAFVACQHPSCEGENKETALFAICDSCGNVQELLNDKLVTAVKSVAGEADFSMKDSVVELRGVCGECRSA
jgi:Fur family zinc uptake transcriptional regulator